MDLGNLDKENIKFGIACINKTDLVNLYSKNQRMFKFVKWYLVQGPPASYLGDGTCLR